MSSKTLLAFLVVTIFFATTAVAKSYAQSQKGEDEEKERLIISKCILNEGFMKSFVFPEGPDAVSEEDAEYTSKCNHNMLYLIGQCEQHDFEFEWCSSKGLERYIEENGLKDLDRPNELIE